jgi:hypothetical protein
MSRLPLAQGLEAFINSKLPCSLPLQDAGIFEEFLGILFDDHNLRI